MGSLPVPVYDATFDAGGASVALRSGVASAGYGPLSYAGPHYTESTSSSQWPLQQLRRFSGTYAAKQTSSVRAPVNDPGADPSQRHSVPYGMPLFYDTEEDVGDGPRALLPIYAVNKILRELQGFGNVLDMQALKFDPNQAGLKASKQLLTRRSRNPHKHSQRFRYAGLASADTAHAPVPSWIVQQTHTIRCATGGVEGTYALWSCEPQQHAHLVLTDRYTDDTAYAWPSQYVPAVSSMRTLDKVPYLATNNKLPASEYVGLVKRVGRPLHVEEVAAIIGITADPVVARRVALRHTAGMQVALM